MSIGSDNGLAPNSAGLLSFKPLGTNVSKILMKIWNFSFTKVHLKILSAKWRPFCSGGDELIFKPSFCLVASQSKPMFKKYFWLNCVLTGNGLKWNGALDVRTHRGNFIIFQGNQMAAQPTPTILRAQRCDLKWIWNNQCNHTKPSSKENRPLRIRQ